jgi:hypothetical protein
MGSLARRVVAVGVVGVALLLGDGVAAAKVLPVDSVAVVTAQPKDGQPVDVVVRFGQNFDLGDFAWEDNEVAVFPAARTDANGWPLDRNDRGAPVKLRRVGRGVYRGAFVVADAGEYVLVDWSSVAAKEDRASGVVTTRSYAAPVRVRIAGATSAAPASGSGSASRDHWALGAAGLIACVVAGAGVAAWRRRRRVLFRN